MKAWAESFYQSTAWRQTSKDYLTSQHYVCERCGAPAKLVHHRRWLTRDNIHDVKTTLAWENLEALCQDCHNKEHHRGKRQKRYKFDEEGNVIEL